MINRVFLNLTVLFCFITSPAFAASDFNTWLQELRAEATAQGISADTIQAALSNVSPIARVIELDRKQPEGKMTYAQYYNRVISKDRIAQGRRLYRQHKTQLDQVSAQYGVQPQYIVALWGIETSYGNNTGGFGVVRALATLAHDGRRSSFFRKELLNALKIIDAGHISAAAMKGSWAGAMGQNQFMPSSFHAYAVDGNGDGRRDIWTSLPDVFASTANYLSSSGWKGDEKWGREVKLPAGFSKSLTGLEIKKPLEQWSKLGVTLPNGQALPAGSDIQASIVTPDGLGGSAYLAYSNYRTIMKWNKSTYFATSVGLLADQIAQ
ncbi:lytic murein transglycosylase [Alphaproteobacteria bacterium]|nr:lytic murein transglycosylase [Alphaproteobacteria bacterium]